MFFLLTFQEKKDIIIRDLLVPSPKIYEIFTNFPEIIET